MLHYTQKEIDVIEKIFFKSVHEGIYCCADMGICNHDAEWIEDARRQLKREKHHEPVR